MPNFSSLEWTFTEHTVIPTSTGGRVTIVVIGSGPNLYVHVKNPGAGDHAPLDVGIQLCVFEKTNTYVRGFVHLFNGYALAWGDSYIAHFPVHQLLEGGTVCRKNILSTGRQIIAMRGHGRAEFSIFYVDGSVDALLKSQEIRANKTCTARPLGKLRLPLKPTETVTAAYTKTLTTYLGTSHGEIFTAQISFTILQEIIRSFWGDGSQNSTVLCFENGSIVAWNKNQWTEVKGRYTCISFSPIGMVYPVGNHDNHVFAGDMDGNLTVFRVSPGQIVPYRTVRGLTLNPITVLDNVGKGAEMLIGSKMGELQLIDAQSFDKNGHPPNSRPGCIDDNRCFYKTRNGWYFLRNDQLWKAFKCMSPDSGDTAKPMEKYFEAKNMKIKYLCCSGRPHREIIFAYSRQGYFARVTEHPEDNEAIEYSGGHHTADPIIILQVILMQSYILIQLDSGIVQLFHIGDMRKTNRLDPASHFKTTGRITAAAFVANSGPPLDLMVAYLDGRVEVGQAGWNGISNFHFSPVPMDLRGSHIVSMIYSQGRIGISQCILLSRKGIVYIAANSTLDHYVTVHQQDLSPFIGRGHSLIETVWGILAVGFKQTTLHVCWISLAAFVPCQYRHLFSVDTRSSRLPFTIASCCSCPSCCWGLSVSYHHKDGFKEDRFPFLQTPIIHGFKHSGIITTCLQPDMEDPNGNKLIHTGDTEGRFCTWAIGQKNVHGQGYFNDYKLNGAVTSLLEIERYVAVTTSQGYLHLFQLYSLKPFLFIPLIPYKMGQKISYMMRFDSLANTFLLVFLGDGTAQQVKFEMRKADKFTVAKCITARKVARFPVPTKLALCIKQEKDYYIIALGIDGILRRTQLSTGGNITIEMGWKISVIKDLLINSVKILMVGDPSGRVYFLITDSEMQNTFYSDRLHHHEIIDVLFHTPDGKDYVFCSLDISGTVAIRRMVIGKPSRYRPELWSCPVPSPRKIEIVGERQIMVVGRGVATRNF